MKKTLAIIICSLLCSAQLFGCADVTVNSTINPPEGTGAATDTPSNEKDEETIDEITDENKAPDSNAEAPIIEADTENVNTEAGSETEDKKTEETTEKAPEKADEAVLLPIEKESRFIFSSGVGAWWTVLYVNPDGSFRGDYTDSNYGMTGDGYPNGTEYVNAFRGKFTDIKQIDEFTYSMTLPELELEIFEKDEWIEEGIKYTVAPPAGFDSYKNIEFMLYMPEKVVDDLPEDFLMWTPGGFEKNAGDTLEWMTLRNMDNDNGFVLND